MKQFLDFVLIFIRPIVSVITPTLKELLVGLAKQFKEFADTTDNQYDDILADFLIGILE